MNYKGILNSSVARAISVHLEPHQGIGTDTRAVRKRKKNHLTNIHFLTSLDGPRILQLKFNVAAG